MQRKKRKAAEKGLWEANANWVDQWMSLRLIGWCFDRVVEIGGERRNGDYALLSRDLRRAGDM
jgi:hypothetical protein